MLLQIVSDGKYMYASDSSKLDLSTLVSQAPDSSIY